MCMVSFIEEISFVCSHLLILLRVSGSIVRSHHAKGQLFDVEVFFFHFVKHDIFSRDISNYASIMKVSNSCMM